MWVEGIHFSGSQHPAYSYGHLQAVMKIGRTLLCEFPESKVATSLYWVPSELIGMLYNIHNDI